MMQEESKGRSWTMWVVIAIIVVLALVFIFWQGPAATPEVGTEDTTSAIDAQLGGIDLGNLEAELGDIDADLNQL